MWQLVVARERVAKQSYVMNALQIGMGGPSVAEVCIDDPKDKTAPFVACGQLWVVQRIVPPAVTDGRPFWLLDNGYYKTSGFNKFTQKSYKTTGHYELTYKSVAPILMNEPDYTRWPAKDVLRPWNPNPSGYILLGIPGQNFGRMIGMDMEAWTNTIAERIRKFSKRHIRIRTKYCERHLSEDLAGAFVCVTHSSNIAVDAIVQGVPAIVAPTNPAAPVCSTNLKDLDNPWMPDRTHWWASLMTQQFTAAEMEDGLAWHHMQKIMAQVDAR